MKIDIQQKYLYIYSEDGENIAYLEHSFNEEHQMGQVYEEDDKGTAFLKKNTDKIHNCSVKLFGKRYLKRKVLFLRKGDELFQRIVLLK